MRWCKAKWSGWAAWLGVIALVLNAIVPIHVAFRLSEGLAATYCGQPEAGGDNLERRLFALLSLQQPSGTAAGHHGNHRGAACPVCSALATLGSLAPVAPAPALPLRIPIAMPAPAAAIAAEPAVISPVGYRSRAPPSA